MRVCSHPTPSSAAAVFAQSPGGPHHGVMARAKYLARLGVETVEDRGQADLLHVTGPDCLPATDVQTINYIWPVDIYPDSPAWWREQNTQMKQACRDAWQVVVNSDYMVEMVDRLSDRLARIVPQAIDPEEWENVVPAGEWRARLGADRDTPLVLWGKNTVDCLRDPRPALALARRQPDTLVVLTASQAAIEEFAADALPANVRCVGVQPYGEMQALLADCDVYLATMLESSGQGHLEAMYLGKPVIGYRWGGVGELAGGVAQLVEPDDLAGLAHALDYALANYATLGSAGRALVEARHLWPAAAAEYKDIYEELLP